MKLSVLFLIIIISSIFISEAFAQNTFTITKPGAGFGIDISQGGNPTGGLGTVLKNIVILFFTVGGLGFTIMIFWGAVGWILSGGDKEQIAGARKRITTAITGLVVLSLSFLIIVIAGQVLSINALQFGDFKVPGLGAP